ncbi:hypothetical protein Fcan01_02007 [Folsomia candida]|uniref:Uncharacterized protein n=1 Tax=Folsomia candida TaxID=158441 RepID=A0A226EZH5_FOLCA|nr:hypothetical protein Fcan01_02007 [Folsomia candida]
MRPRQPGPFTTDLFLHLERRFLLQHHISRLCLRFTSFLKRNLCPSLNSMANQQQILQQLSDYTKFGFELTPPPEIQELRHIWQWRSNGLPVFDDPLQPWARFVPSGVTDQRLINGLRGNQQQFIIVCTGTMKRNLLTCLLMADVKKINVRSAGSNLVITKTAIKLVPFDNIYRQVALRARQGEGITAPKIVIDRCGFVMSQSPCFTQWGPLPHQRLEIRKRFLCSSTNNVYLIHCATCLLIGLWSTYVGSSHAASNFHTRVSHHVAEVCDQQLRNATPLSPLLY